MDTYEPYPDEGTAPAQAISFDVCCLAPPLAADAVAELVSLERATFKRADSWADGELARACSKRSTVLSVARQADTKRVRGGCGVAAPHCPPLTA
jgi:hypothetical protein